MTGKAFAYMDGDAYKEIIVSNHGGRHVVEALAVLDTLPVIATTLGDKLAILFDSGICSVAGIVKAISSPGSRPNFRWYGKEPTQLFKISGLN